MAIDLKATVLGSIVELANSANNPEINPCLEKADPDNCDFGQCADCPFEKSNALLLKSKTDHLYMTAEILGESLEGTLEVLLEGQKANEEAKAVQSEDK